MGITASQMAGASLVMQGAGAGSSVVGSYNSARLQQSNLKSQARLAEINARVTDLAADSVLDQGNQQIARLTLEAGQLQSRQRVAQAANGLDLGEGSAAEVRASSEILKQIDMNTTKANAVRAAWGYRTQAGNLRNEALVSRSAADAISPGLSAATSLLGSAGSVAGSWYAFNKAGATGGSATAPADDPLYALGQSRNWW